MTKQDFSRMLKTGIQYLPVDSIQTSVQEYLESQAAKSLSPLEKEEKRACLYSVRPLGSGFVDVKTTAVVTKDFKHRVPPVKIFVGLAGTGHPAKASQLRKR